VGACALRSLPPLPGPLRPRGRRGSQASVIATRSISIKKSGWDRRTRHRHGPGRRFRNATLLPCRLRTRISTASSATSMRPYAAEYPTPGWVIFQSATLGQFCIGGNKRLTMPEKSPGEHSGSKRASSLAGSPVIAKSAKRQISALPRNDQERNR